MAEKTIKKKKISASKEMPNNQGKVMELIEKMSVLELSELVHSLEEKFGVTAAQQVVAAPQAQVVEEKPEEEKTEFDCILTGFGDNKIRVIKLVREITELGLKESKELVDNAPKPIKEKISREEAEEIKKKIEATGGTAEIK